MNSNYTVEEIAADSNLWETYIDPDNNAPFDSMTENERIDMIKEIFPAAVNKSIEALRLAELEKRYGPAENW